MNAPLSFDIKFTLTSTITICIHVTFANVHYNARSCTWDNPLFSAPPPPPPSRPWSNRLPKSLKVSYDGKKREKLYTRPFSVRFMSSGVRIRAKSQRRKTRCFVLVFGFFWQTPRQQTFVTTPTPPPLLASILPMSKTKVVFSI